jgi:hypothetical protein
MDFVTQQPGLQFLNIRYGTWFIYSDMKAFRVNGAARSLFL